MSAATIVRPTPVRTVNLTPGFYRHYKGTIYRVIGTGWHSDTDQEFVLYHQADDTDRMFVRPIDTFMELVEIDGQSQARYALIEAKAFQGDESNG